MVLAEHGEARSGDCLVRRVTEAMNQPAVAGALLRLVEQWQQLWRVGRAREIGWRWH